MSGFSTSVTIAVLTGFLGSGKSTLLNRLLRTPGMPRTAVVVNELGEVGIDNLLVESVTEGVALLNSGCLCCAVRSDLEQTLQDLYLKRVRGVIPEFTHAIIETTGLANPGPILQTLLSASMREKRYSVATVLTTVDAVNATASMSRYSEARQQIAVADRLLLTKGDLSTPVQIDALQPRLRGLNPLAPVVRVPPGSIDLAAIIGSDFLEGKAEQDWSRHAGWSDQLHAHAQAAHQHPHDSPHDESIRADCYVLEGAIEWETLHRNLRRLLADHGERLLRFKAIVRLQGVDHPVALHAVHHSLYPPDELPSQGDAEMISRLVFISDGLDHNVIEDAVATLKS